MDVRDGPHGRVEQRQGTMPRSRSIILLGFLHLLGYCAGVFAVAAPALAAGPEHGLGPVFSGHIEVAGKQIPLPVGTWAVVGDGHSARRNPQTEAYGAIRNVVLAAARGSQVTALAVINTNTIGVERGWLFGEPCLVASVHYSDMVGNAADGACVLVTHVLTAAEVNASAAWVEALNRLGEAGIRVPSTWLSVRIVASDRADFIDVRYYINPELHGFGPVARRRWQDNAWHPSQIPPGSEKARFIDSLVTWGLGLRPFVRDGLRRRLDETQAIPWPWTLAQTAIPPALARKLYKLEDLRARGVIGQSEFDAQTELILTSAVDEGEKGLSSFVEALAKTISWRAVASADTMLISYLLTGDVRTASSIAVLEVGSKLAAYFGHEMLWNAFLDHQGDLANPIELESAGIDHPQEAMGERSWSAILLSWLPFGGESGGVDPLAVGGTSASLHPAADVVEIEPAGAVLGAGAPTAGEPKSIETVAGGSARLRGPVPPTEQRLEEERFLGLIPIDWLP